MRVSRRIAAACLALALAVTPYGALGESVLLSPYFATAAANYTPAIAFGGGSVGQTFSTQNGFYTKVNRLVTLCAKFVFTAKGSSTGAATITLPIAAANTGTGYAGFFSPTLGANLTLVTGAFGYVADGDTNITLRALGATGDSGLSDTNFASNSQIAMCGEYMSAS